MGRIKVEEAAKQLGIAPCAVRRQMQIGMLPIGDILHGEHRSTFYIYQEKVDKYLEKIGKEVT